MDKLVHKLNEEMKCWVGDLVSNSDISSDKLLARYSYEYCIKKEITDYFECNVISDELEQFLLNRDDALEYLYQEYMSDDTANIQNEIEGFISNVIYKFKTIVKLGFSYTILDMKYCFHWQLQMPLKTEQINRLKKGISR